MFWPFLQGQSWKGSSQETTEPSAKKKADGQRLCQTNSCCCSCWMDLPKKSWGIRESHLQRFSGIYVPGRSSGQGVEPQDVTETSWECSELVRLGEQGTNVIPWKSVQNWLRHWEILHHLHPAFLLENQHPPLQHLRETNQPKMRETRGKRTPGKAHMVQSPAKPPPPPGVQRGSSSRRNNRIMENTGGKAAAPAPPCCPSSPWQPHRGQQGSRSCSLMSGTEGPC